jgi:hypothetical protein
MGIAQEMAEVSADLTTSLYCLRGSGATACASGARHLRRQVTLVDSNVALRQGKRDDSDSARDQPPVRVESESDPPQIRLGWGPRPTRRIRPGSACHRVPPAVPPT